MLHHVEKIEAVDRSASFPDGNGRDSLELLAAIQAAFHDLQVERR
jgi:hypothetical protein